MIIKCFRNIFNRLYISKLLCNVWRKYFLIFLNLLFIVALTLWFLATILLWLQMKFFQAHSTSLYISVILQYSSVVWAFLFSFTHRLSVDWRSKFVRMCWWVGHSIIRHSTEIGVILWSLEMGSRDHIMFHLFWRALNIAFLCLCFKIWISLVALVPWKENVLKYSHF